VLTPEAFEKLLACLDSNRERAGEKYEQLRLKLVRFFEWRGALFPEDQADEALNRIIRRIDEGEEIRNLSNYCYGIARLLLLESLKELEHKRAALDELPTRQSAPEDPGEGELRLRCFEDCMSSLPLQTCELITQYYQKEKRAKIEHRKELAAQLGIPLNALRIRAYRIREQLETCVDDCLKQSQGR